VSPSYFSTLGIKILKGRALSDRDTFSSPKALVINERLAKRFFNDADPIGQRILIQEIIPGKTGLGPDISWEVVGMIGDEKIGGPQDVESAGVYVSHEQSPVYGMVLSVRGNVNPLSLQKDISKAVWSVNKDQALTNIQNGRSNPRSADGRPPHRHDPPCHVQHDRAAAGGRRNLRCDLLLRRATHARDGDSRGSRRVAATFDAIGPGSRRHPDGSRSLIIGLAARSASHV
jgi:hypothetical protein